MLKILRGRAKNWELPPCQLRSSSSLPLISALRYYSPEIRRSFDETHGLSRSPGVVENRLLNSNLVRFVDSYRSHGHLKADLDPLRISRVKNIAVAELSLENYGVFNPSEIYSIEGILHFPNRATRATASEIQAHLERTYCSKIGAEYQHLPSSSERDWFSLAFESCDWSRLFSPAEKRNLHSLLFQSQTFDEFFAKKFVSFKKYGLEGCESMIITADTIISEAVNYYKVNHIIIGMPHRGRLNLLTTLLDYPPRTLFRKVKGESLIPAEFDAAHDDVISHISHQTVKSTPFFHKITLLPNPSHLEAINPVSQGYSLATLHEDQRPLCLQFHGDAAFVGQGVVTESLMMGGLSDFNIEGVIHVIVNNQIGFTAGVDKSRSTLYASDIAKGFNFPVLHVNADDPLSVAYVSKLAASYRDQFKKDIIIDLIGYRKLGHNEVDEPAFTQPAMYKEIRKKESAATLFAKKLEEEELLNKEQLQKLKIKLESYLEAEYQVANTGRESLFSASKYLYGPWSSYQQPRHCHDIVDTGIASSLLHSILLDSIKLPMNFNVHPRLERSHVAHRLSMIKNDSVDWSSAEAVALGSLLHDGYNVRMSGQDVERGTFSHRHAVLIDQLTEEKYCPLSNSNYEGKMQFVSSHLSEYGVLGFEYGYSLYSSNNLVIWEAQFGDFANTAAVIIDNFIASGECKWLRMSSLVLLLPHGFDGAGPDHSSARIERYLQLSDELGRSSGENRPVNLLIANPTTPAQYFHLLRRQMIRKYKKPLIIISPKTLLRFPKATSSFQEMSSSTHFHPFFSDSMVKRSQVTTLVFCTGKVYYDLCEEREKRKLNSTAFLRIEELSPFPWDAIRAELSAYSEQKIEIIWFQEEGENAGAWNYIQPRLSLLMEEQKSLRHHKVIYVGRNPLAAAAVGNWKEHKKEAEELFHQLFSRQ